MDGVRSIVAEILKGTGGKRQSRAFAILKRSEVPREQIVSYLLESAQASRPDLETFLVYFYLFNQYPEDDRILKFLAPLLEDKTTLPSRRRKPGEEPSQEERWRLCDSAHGTIVGILARRGEIKPGDPGFGDPGGEANTSRRDVNIAALKPMLIASGYLSTAPGLPQLAPVATPEKITPLPTSPPQIKPSPNTSKDVAPAHSSIPTMADGGPPAQKPVHWLTWLAAGVLSFVSAALFWKCRK